MIYIDLSSQKAYNALNRFAGMYTKPPHPDDLLIPYYTRSTPDYSNTYLGDFHSVDPNGAQVWLYQYFGAALPKD